MAAVSGGAAVGGSNPSGDGGPRLRSPPGKGSKPAALSDITNTGKPNPSRSVRLPDANKENAKLFQTLNEKTKIIEMSRVEIHKLRIVLQSYRQTNQQLATINSQMLAELNAGKERIKTLQHNLSCTEALLKVKDSEVERKNRREVTQEVLKVGASKVAEPKSHQVHGSGTSGLEQSALSNSVCQELPQDAKKRGRKKRKSDSNECIEDTNIMQEHFKQYLQPVMSLDHDEPRKPQRRRSSRLSQASCEMADVSLKTLHEDTLGPSAPSTSKSLQNECSAIVSEEIAINEEPQKEENLKEIQEGCSRVTGTDRPQIDVTACSTSQNHLASQTSGPFMDNIESLKRPVTTGIRRSSSRQKLAALCEAVKAAEDLNSKCDMTTSSEPLCQENKRKSRTKESAMLNPVPSEGTKGTFDTLEEDAIAPLASSNSIASVEQKTTQKKNDAGSSMKSAEGQVVAGRRSLRRAAEKVISYREVPLNVKMRRP